MGLSDRAVQARADANEKLAAALEAQTAADGSESELDDRVSANALLAEAYAAQANADALEESDEASAPAAAVDEASAPVVGEE